MTTPSSDSITNNSSDLFDVDFSKLTNFQLLKLTKRSEKEVTEEEIFFGDSQGTSKERLIKKYNKRPNDVKLLVVLACMAQSTRAGIELFNRAMVCNLSVDDYLEQYGDVITKSTRFTLCYEDLIDNDGASNATKSNNASGTNEGTSDPYAPLPSQHFSICRYSYNEDHTPKFVKRAPKKLKRKVLPSPSIDKDYSVGIEPAEPEPAEPHNIHLDSNNTPASMKNGINTNNVVSTAFLQNPRQPVNDGDHLFETFDK